MPNLLPPPQELPPPKPNPDVPKTPEKAEIIFSTSLDPQ
jgi:hypothetical protein